MMTPETATHEAIWAQAGVTHVVAAQAFLNTLRRRDVLCFYGGDGESGMPVNSFNDRSRGQGVSLSTKIIAATPPSDDLLAYHRSIGLGPENVLCPSFRPRVPLALSCLGDAVLMGRLCADTSLRGIFFRYKDKAAAELASRLGLECTGCGPKPQTYAALNDKAALAHAGHMHGFDTLPVRLTTTLEEMEAAFRELHAMYEEGCVLRLRNGVGGHGLKHARTLKEARQAWKRLRTHGEVLVIPFIPASQVLRNLSLHGFVTEQGFSPLVVTDQVMRGFGFRGARCVEELSSDELEAVRACLPGLGAWLRGAEYVDAPAGVDGFLMRGPQGPRFVIVDPNIRMTNTMRPWSVVADISARTGRRFVWQFEWVVMLGQVGGMHQLRQRLGADLLDASRLEQGGILPSVMGRFGLGPMGALRMEVIFIGRDAAHLEHLRRRLGDLGFRWR